MITIIDSKAYVSQVSKKAYPGFYALCDDCVGHHNPFMCSKLDCCGTAEGDVIYVAATSTDE